MAVARFIKQALIGALAFVGALYLGFHALVWMISPGDTAPSSAEIVSSILSPDGEHKAVIFSLVGPGFSPGPNEYIGVVATAQADATAWAGHNLVFKSNCASLGETYDDMKKSVAWKSTQLALRAAALSRPAPCRACCRQGRAWSACGLNDRQRSSA